MSTEVDVATGEAIVNVRKGIARWLWAKFCVHVPREETSELALFMDVSVDGVEQIVAEIIEKGSDA